MSFKKDDEAGAMHGVGSFYNDKTSVIQEARVFNESPISPRKCRILLTKVLYLLYGGDTFNRQEATTLFFGATKLFQHKDPALRQMVYLAIKELCPLADDTIMVTASIMKDMQPNMEVIYRPNAIRALSRVVDPSMVQGLERFFKSAIVDRNTSISSAALVSAYQLYIAARDVVKRWSNEAQEAITPKAPVPIGGSGGGGGGGGGVGIGGLPGMGSFGGLGSSVGYLGGWGQPPSSQSINAYQAIPSSSFITQYHALGLLYLIRQGDRMAVTKLVQQMSGAAASARGSAGTLRSPFAVCMLARYAGKVAEEDPNLRAPMVDLLEGWLHHKSDMVNYEAARTLCELRGVTSAELGKAIAVLQLFLSSPKSTLKFAAVRTLARLAQTHPDAVQSCNVDLENLISDPNRSVATYAITTLLKTGNEASVDRLMKQISSFMSDIGDEFKVIVVDAIRSLCLKFPSKQMTMLAFLAGVLRDEGGYEFKRAVVEAIFDMVQFIGDCKETALAHLCEFIEDCEFTKLSVRILHLLGVEGPKMAQPHKYIRYIYNRVILENAIVRAAAVNALAKFGLGDKALTARITVLLERCLDDVDDEVRDRAAINLKLLRQGQRGALRRKLVTDDGSQFRLAELEASLAAYIGGASSSSSSSSSAAAATTTRAFDASKVSRVTREERLHEALRARNDAARRVAMAAEAGSSKHAAGGGGAGAAGGSGSAAGTGLGAAAAAANGSAAGDAGVGALGGGADVESRYASELAEVEQFKSYGPPLRSSSRAVELTERETEYVVTAVKHVFAEHIVLQYNVTNTLQDTVLDNVAVVVGGAAELGLTEDFILPVTSLNAETPSGRVYVSFTRGGGGAAAGGQFALGALSSTLKFSSREVDPSTGEAEEQGYDDEYEVESLELGVADYLRPTFADFAAEWKRLEGKGHEATETYALSALESLKAACDTMVELLGMMPLGGSEVPTSSAVHTLNLSAVLPGGGGGGATHSAKVLARCRMTFESGAGVTMELGVRSESEAACALVMGAIG